MPMNIVSAHHTLALKYMKNSLHIISTLSLIVGVLGMAGGFIYLSAIDMADIVAGTSGFLAGSVLFGCSLIALAILAKDE